MNAASVLPLPVGAQRRTSKPSASSAAPITGHPRSCAREGVSKRRSNHTRTAGWKSSRAVGIYKTIIIARRPYKKDADNRLAGGTYEGSRNSPRTRRGLQRVQEVHYVLLLRRRQRLEGLRRCFALAVVQ